MPRNQFQTNKPPAGTDRIYSMTAAGPDSFDILILSKSPDGKPIVNVAVWDKQ